MLTGSLTEFETPAGPIGASGTRQSNKVLTGVTGANFPQSSADGKHYLSFIHVYISGH